MAGAKVVRQLLIEFEVSGKELAEMLGMSAQSLSNKMSRDSFTYDEMAKIAEILNCKLLIRTKEGKEFY